MFWGSILMKKEQQVKTSRSYTREEQREKKEAQPEEQKEKATRKETAVVSAPKVVPLCLV